jgi:hypothetical protein
VNIDWIILAEGFGTAANGAVTVIGINQQVIIAPSLPTTTKRGVLAHFSSDSNDTLIGPELDVTISVNDPNGRPLITQTAPARMNTERQWPELPVGLDIYLELPLRLSEYGSYEISLSLKQPGADPITGVAPFYVKKPPAVPSDPSETD